MHRQILHADMDAFYAAIEQRDDPSLRGKPVVIAGLGPRGVVSTASYEARRFGVHSALPTALAQQRCPNATFLRPRMEDYVAESRRIRSIFDRYTPLIEPLSLDEAFLDVSGSTLLFGEGRRIAESLKREVFEETGLRVSVGLAPNKFLAKVASDLDKPDGLVQVEAGREREFLAPLPIQRLWGLGPKSCESLEDRGIFRIHQLQELGDEDLRGLLGERMGLHVRRLSHGLDDRPVEVGRTARSISQERTFGKDLPMGGAALAILLDQAELVGARLRAKGLRGATLRLKIRFPPFETHTRQARFEHPSSDDLELYKLGCRLLEEANPSGRALRLLGLGVADLVPEGRALQSKLFDAPDPRRRQALEALDSIREKHGRVSISRARNPAREGPEP